MIINKTIRTIFPPILGYTLYYFGSNIFDNFSPQEEFDNPGIIIILAAIFLFIWAIIVFTVQYKVVVPKTFISIKKASMLALILSLISALSIALLFSSESNDIEKIALAFCRTFVECELFFMGNLFLIKIFNEIEKYYLNRNGL